MIVLYAFLLSINLMGVSFKFFGMDFAKGLFELTANPFVGLFVGILATSLIQSSSSTTALVVGLVAAGVLDLTSAIPIIMGANVGTSVTNLLVSLSHSTKNGEFKKAFSVAVVHDIFNVLTLLVIFPLEMAFHLIEKSAIVVSGFFVGTTASTFSSPIAYLISPVANWISVELLMKNAIVILFFALGILFMSLNIFVRIAKPLAKTELKDVIHNSLFRSPRRAFVFGIALTAFVQSSSVTTSLMVPMAAVGLLTINKIYPYILGANIGTTITAFLAALAIGSPVALTVAMAHLIYNLFGITIFFPLKKIPITLAQKFTEYAIHSRRYAIFYIVVAFYGIPAAIIFLV